MEGAVRLFAGEFCQCTVSVPGEDAKSQSRILLPSGVYCRQVFLAGVLTELHAEGDSIMARLADPTGGFDLVCSSRNSPVAGALTSILLPSFVSVSGRAQLYRRGNEIVLSVRPDHLRSIDRPARDQWILATAEATLSRLELVRRTMAGNYTDEQIVRAVSHYHLTHERLDNLAALVESAVRAVRPQEPGPVEQPDARNLVLGILKIQAGPRGVAVQDIVDTLSENGVYQDATLAAIRLLISEDECYQPQKGYIRLL